MATTRNTLAATPPDEVPSWVPTAPDQIPPDRYPETDQIVSITPLLTVNYFCESDVFRTQQKEWISAQGLHDLQTDPEYTVDWDGSLPNVNLMYARHWEKVYAITLEGKPLTLLIL